MVFIAHRVESYIRPKAKRLGCSFKEGWSLTAWSALCSFSLYLISKTFKANQYAEVLIVANKVNCKGLVGKAFLETMFISRDNPKGRLQSSGVHIRCGEGWH